MPTINLLPWREELRQKRKREFLIAAFGAVLLGGALTFGTKFFYQSQIAAQNERNNLLRTEIAELDRQIEEINELDAQKSRLLARMEIIDQLQRSRPEAVHLMDEAVEILPEGAHLTEFRQEGSRIEITGV
ncbi:MAG: pilus assembly protein PilN, partial [Gammaproteobacteria bacterium]